MGIFAKKWGFCLYIFHIFKKMCDKVKVMQWKLYRLTSLTSATIPNMWEHWRFWAMDTLYDPMRLKCKTFSDLFTITWKLLHNSMTSTVDFFKDLNMVELKIKVLFASWSFLSHIRLFYGYFLPKKWGFCLYIFHIFKKNVW